MSSRGSRHSDARVLQPIERRAHGILAFGTIRSFARRKPLGAASAVVILILILAAAFAPQIAPYDPTDPFYLDALKPPSTRYFLGTDMIGRDVFSRLIYGARISVVVGLGAVSMGVGLGLVWGTLSGYFGGKVDLVIQRFMDAIQAIPGLLIAMVLVATLGGSVINMIFAIGFTMQARANRVVRGSVLSVKQNSYIEAASAIGASHLRIMLRHMLPNIFAPLAIIISVDLGAAILTEASLSFLGVGVAPPTPTWGGMLSSEGRAYFEPAPWMAVFPGLAISVIVLAFNLLGDSLRDTMDPRLRT